MKTIVGIALVLASTGAAAQVNKCIDKSGKVVGYAAECPAGSRSEQLQIQKGPPGGGKSLAERDAEFKKRQVERKESDAKDQKKQAENDQRKAACEQSQAYLKGLEGRQRVTRTDPKTGERAFLDESQYGGEMAKAKKSIAENCK